MIVAIALPVRPDADLSDLTSKTVVNRGYREDSLGRESYFVEFATDLTPAEETAIRRRLSTSSAVEETLNGRAVSAYLDLLAFENLATPTQAQTLAAVRLLCRVERALIRLELGQLEATD